MKLFDHVEEGHDVLAAILRELSTHEIEGLHAVGAFVDHRDAGVARELGHAPFLDIAMTAIELLGLDRHVIALIGQRSL